MDTFIVILIVTGAGVMILLCCTDRLSRPVSPAPLDDRIQVAQCSYGSAAAFSLLVCSEGFDPDRALIWGTQVPALRFVSRHEPRGTCETRLTLVYAELASRYPEIYDGYTFSQWLEFLVGIRVFCLADEAVHITPAGRHLLQFLLKMQPQSARTLTVAGFPANTLAKRTPQNA